LLLPFLALLAGLAGCATARYVRGPDGYPSIYIRCPSGRMDKCEIKAQRTCPYGYDVVEPPSYEQLALFVSKKTRRSGRNWKRHDWTFFQQVGLYRLSGTVAWPHTRSEPRESPAR
jgi:hypothetical protein